MAEAQAKHRQSLERIVLEGRAKAESRAPILGTVLAVVIGGFGTSSSTRDTASPAS